MTLASRSGGGPGLCDLPAAVKAEELFSFSPNDRMSVACLRRFMAIVKLFAEGEGAVSRSAMLKQPQLKEFRDAFKIFDVDNSETITTDELLLVMKNLGMMATKEEVKEMLSEVDEDGSGEIDFEEFAELMVKQMKQGSEQEVREAFKAYDTDNKGYFTKDELLKLLMVVSQQSKDIKISKDEIEELVKYCEKNGRVNFDKFVKELMK